MERSKQNYLVSSDSDSSSNGSGSSDNEATVSSEESNDTSSSITVQDIFKLRDWTEEKQ